MSNDFSLKLVKLPLFDESNELEHCCDGEMLSAKALLGIFLLELWLPFSKHSHSKQMLPFFSPPESQLVKCLEYPRILLR